MPDLKRAELIEGVVHLASPVSFSHGVAHAAIIWLVKTYAIAARYCIAASNATWIVQPDALQPDVILAVRPDFGGRSRLQGRYLTGAPELVVEISVTSQPLDKGPKVALYRSAGVQEYVTIEMNRSPACGSTPKPSGAMTAKPWSRPFASDSGNDSSARGAHRA